MAVLKLRTLGASYLIDGFDRRSEEAEGLFEALEARYGQAVAAVRQAEPVGSRHALQALLVDRKCGEREALKESVSMALESAGRRPISWSAELTDKGAVERLSYE